MLTAVEQSDLGRPRRRLALSLWSSAVVVAWGLAWLFYAEIFDLDTCFLGTAHGGRAHSEGWAGFGGFLLLLLAALLALRWRRRLVLLFAAFVTLYVAGLLALWAISPAVWGHVRCTYSPL